VSARTRGKLASYLVVGPFAIVLAFPFYWMAMTAFKSELDLYNPQNVPFYFNQSDVPGAKEPTLPEWLPLGIENATLDNFRYLFSETQYVQWMENTVLVGIVVVVFTLLVSVPAGYALARLSGGWGRSLGVGIFLVYLVPPTLLFLPLSRVIVELGRLPGIDDDRGLQDSLWSLALVYPSFTIPFSTWLLMGFFKTIPLELEDAALVDGASRVRTLRSIILPVSVPGILTVVIFSFSLVVNEFVYAVSFITTSDSKVISTGIYTELIRGDVFYWGALMAATLIPSIPLALLYNTFLDRFIQGFTGGAFR
jgi:multiple sugar transport system permease protein